MTINEFMKKYKIIKNPDDAGFYHVNCKNTGGSHFCLNQCPVPKNKLQGEFCKDTYRRLKEYWTQEKLDKIKEILK